MTAREKRKLREEANYVKLEVINSRKKNRCNRLEENGNRLTDRQRRKLVQTRGKKKEREN